MEKNDLAQRLARRRKITKAKAADQVDGVVHDILRKLRSGQTATLPGLGVLTPGRKLRLEQAVSLPSAKKPRRSHGG